MPAIDEDLLSDLMHRATRDLHAPAAVCAGIVTSHRRRGARNRVIGASAAALAAITAVGVVAATSGTTDRHRPVALPKIELTAAQRTLNHLSLAAARAKASDQTGRYVVMPELEGKDKRTTIMDSLTGDVWTFQKGAGIPSTFPVSRHGSPTQAQLAAYPTSVAGLRKLLLAQARHDEKVAIKFELKAIRIKDPGHVKQVRKTVLHSILAETRDDMIFSQDAYLLWNPLVTPTLRSALFKVLEATPGVVVNSHAKDNIGRAAVEISRYDKANNYTEAIFESPDATRVLETVSIHPATVAQNGLPAEHGYSLPDTYLSITRTNHRPTHDPYTK